MRRSKVRRPRLVPLIASLACVLSGSLDAQQRELAISPLFADHAVLQRGEPIRFWGTAQPGAAIRGSFAGEAFATNADAAGAWSVELASRDAGGPFELRVAAGDASLASDNILVGDVWLCSGQSNMGWRLEQSDRGAEFIAAADNGMLRMLQANRRTAHEPISAPDVRDWTIDSPESAGRFSAVGYHFGRLLQLETGVPIGLIESTWGGTPAEAWTPEQTLRAHTEWSQPLLDVLPDYDLSSDEVQAKVDAYEAEHAAYIAAILSGEQGLPAGWHLPEYDDAAWTSIEAPGFWEPTIGSVDGIVWLRRTITLSADDAAAGGTLSLGMVEEYDDTYVNGQRIGGMNYPSRGAGRTERVYTIEPGVLREGDNTIAVRAVDTRTAGGFGSPPGTMLLKTPASSISLDGAWKIRVSHDARDDGGFPLEGARMVTAARQHRRPAALYNGMIHQFAPVPIKGVIWYQGESNNGRAEQYAKLFPAMIESWRLAWSAAGASRIAAGDTPFLFVQLPNYRARNTEPEESGWAELRAAQEAALELASVGMAVAIDLGAADDIHPRNKLPVAERLAAIAIADVYGRPDPVAQSPRMSLCTLIPGGGVLVRLSNAQGLKTTDGSPPKGFALAGDDGILRWASAAIESDGIRVWHPEISRPTQIRYAWAWNPEVNTVNAGEKPVTPFRAMLGEQSHERR